MQANDELLINVMPGETRAAVMSGGALVELFVERRGRESLVGNVYLGRVERVLKGVDAAFVDLGIGRAGFLGLDAARDVGDGLPPADGDRIGDYLTEGQAVTVQVVKDAIGRKGVQLARRITLPGRYLVYTPSQHRISVSRQIADEDEQQRLSGLMAGLAEPGEGFILRTAAAGADAAELARDAEVLRDTWIDVEAARDQAAAPAMLRAELDPLLRIVRDSVQDGMSAVRIDSPGGFAAAKSFCERFMPRMAGRIVPYDGAEPLFEAYDVEGEIERALAPRLGLPSGGGIVIESTEALTAIDVNSGSFVAASGPEETALHTNREAAAEIARQIRLRNIGGLIVIDFIHMEEEADWAEVLGALEADLARDRTPSRVIGLTAAGLVEITRRRRRESLVQTMAATCVPCAGAGWVRSAETVAYDLMRALRREARAAAPGALSVHASAEVVDVLEDEARGAFDELVGSLGRAVALNRAPGYDRERFDIAVAPGSGAG